MASRAINGQLPRGLPAAAVVDPSGGRFSARVDDATYERPGRPRCSPSGSCRASPRPTGPSARSPNHLFAVVAVVARRRPAARGRVVLAPLAALVAARGRRGRGRRGHPAVARPDADGAGAGGLDRPAAPGAGCPGRCTSWPRSDVLPGSPLSGLEQVGGSSYVVRGRVVDARERRAPRARRRFRAARCETGRHRIRADIRDSTEVRGTLCFTPTAGAADPALYIRCPLVKCADIPYGRVS